MILLEPGGMSRCKASDCAWMGRNQARGLCLELEHLRSDSGYIVFFDNWVSVVDLLNARCDAKKLGFKVLWVLVLVQRTLVVLRAGRKLALGR